MKNIKNKGLLLVISGPSGTGKGTLVERLIQRRPEIRLSISATTRKPREGEVDGVDYFFKTKKEFQEMIEKDEFVEWVEYCGNYYGTPEKSILDSIESGYDVIFEIEVEGALKVKERFPNSILIFMVPPSLRELQKRIRGRGTEEEAIIKKRMRRAVEELNLIDKYDYIVVNDELDRAYNDVVYIMEAEKLKVSRNKDRLKRMGLL